MVAWYWLVLALSIGGSLGFCIAGIIFGGSLESRAGQNTRADWSSARGRRQRSPLVT